MAKQTEARRLVPYSQQVASKLEYFKSKLPPAERKVIAMKRLTVGGVELNVVVRGSGLPLLLAHAFPLDHSMWSAQIERFGSQAQVIAPDLRGFGSSGVTVGTVSMEQMADDLAAILDQLGVGEPVVLAGLSMGGYVAWQFARKYPQRLRALVLANTRATADTPEARQGRMNLVEQVLSAGPAVGGRRHVAPLVHGRKLSAGFPARSNSCASGFCFPRPRGSPPRCVGWRPGPT